MTTFYKIIKDLAKTQKTVMATIVESPQQEAIGQKALYAQKGFIEKTIHPVWQEIEAELGAIASPRLICRGETQVFAEVVSGSPKLIICGGGHISLPVAKIAKLLDFEVAVIDDRLGFAHIERFPGVDQVICKDFKEALAEIPEDANNYFVIVTRGHQYDQVCLRAILEKNHAYIGMIGSKSRVRLVKQAMLEDGVMEELVETVHTPIGLKIGAETPEEIAVAILAEIIQVKNQKIAGGGLSKEIMAAIFNPDLAATPKALVTIILRKGSAPRQTGTKMLVLNGGSCIGTIGGGCVEAEVRRQAMLTLQDGKCRSLRVDMTGRDVEDEGMVCGGIVDVFVELL